MDRDRLAYVSTGIVTITILVFLILFFRLYVDWLWFSSLNFASVFWTAFWTKLIAGLVFGLLFLMLLIPNLYWAVRSIRRGDPLIQAVHGEELPRAQPSEGEPSEEEQEADNTDQDDENGTWEVHEASQPTLTEEGQKYLLISAGIFFTLIAAMAGLARWDLFLRYIRQQTFALKEPIFGKDISFFVFSLPVWKFFYLWLLVSLAAITALVIAIYYMRRAIIAQEGQPLRLADYVKTHLSALGGMAMLLIAFRYWLKTYELLYSSRGVAFGANYTDVNAQIWVFRMLILAAIASAVALLVNLRYRRRNLPTVVVGSFIGLILVFSILLPKIIQRLVVEPSELKRDQQYIRYNIDFTRRAYRLENVQEEPFAAVDELTSQDIAENNPTIQNIRIWDKRPLLQTYEQVQELRTYYSFGDVDEDRYVLDGRYQQVMLSARELPARELPKRTWVNEKLQYTHGYGLVMSPVSQVSSRGLPRLQIRDIPPVSDVDLSIEQPEIYYGEQTRGYVIVGTSEDEIDYPQGDRNAYTRYKGTGGVPVNSFFRRLAFSTKFLDLKLLLTGYLTEDSRILLNRSLDQRLRTIAPFLHYDGDPYLVLWGGRLYWIQDAYTITNMYPYSQKFQGANLNYIRNSVKVILDAYNGTLSFYVMDASDPIIQTYMKIYPELFLPLRDMPAGLKSHIRYPRDLFRIQASIYRLYHMQDVQVFYNQEDLWEIPYEMYSDTKQLMDPYYVTLKLPDTSREEFVLILPFTPANKDNMISWIAARSDVPHYGELLVYKVPKRKLVFGPLQIEASIDQETEISSQLTLWMQKGSRVIRGNLLVIPIKRSFLYVEPVYLEAQQSEQMSAQQPSQMPPEGQELPPRSVQRSGRMQRSRRAGSAALPELKQVIVAYGEQVVMKESLNAALEAVFGSLKQTALPSAVQPTQTTLQPAPLTEVHGLTATALDHYRKARVAVQEWDWTTFSEELDKLEETLLKMVPAEQPGD